MNDDKEKLLAVVREYYGRVVWTHKTHEKDRELSSSRAKQDKWINVVLISLTTTGVLVSIPFGEPWLTIATALLAFVSTGFALYQVSFSPEESAYKHRQAAKSLLIERDNLVLLIEKLMASDTDVEKIRKDANLIIQRVGHVYSSAPDTTSKAFELAGKALKFNEEFTFSETELDWLLPEQLRVNDSSPE
jgi:hypothetical protein